MGFKSDIEIAQEAVVQDIREIAKKLKKELRAFKILIQKEDGSEYIILENKIIKIRNKKI